VVHPPTMVQHPPTMVQHPPTMVQPAGPHVVHVVREPARHRRGRPRYYDDERYEDDGYLYSREYWEDWEHYYAWQGYLNGGGGYGYNPHQHQQYRSAQVLPPPNSKLWVQQDGKAFEFVRNKSAKGPKTACGSKYTEVAPGMPTHDRAWSTSGALRAEYYPK